ncbi:hypothetical protein [Fodinicola acaciae]|uniref:hypothetical protein n=1 Tax=Fodinicola acaciae TaxID=2681555 RepID=UPI0013D0F392|nr:hypothetical protein [Fodinicola acaciae]
MPLAATTTATVQAVQLADGLASAMPLLAIAAVTLVGTGLVLIQIGRKRGVR